jgi:hypothetical protein
MTFFIIVAAIVVEIVLICKFAPERPERADRR